MENFPNVSWSTETALATVKSLRSKVKSLTLSSARFNKSTAWPNYLMLSCPNVSIHDFSRWTEITRWTLLPVPFLMTLLLYPSVTISSWCRNLSDKELSTQPRIMWSRMRACGLRKSCNCWLTSWPTCITTGLEP